MTPTETAILVAVVAGAFGVGGTILGGRQEHRKWLRERRLDAYQEFLSAVIAASGSHAISLRRISDQVEHATAPASQLADMAQELKDAIIAIPDQLGRTASVAALLGPPSVSETVEPLRSAALDHLLRIDSHDREGLNQREQAFIASAQRALRAR